MRTLRTTALASRPLLAFVLAFACLLAGGTAWAQNTGSADFTRYVAVGDSLTAGFASGGLLDEVQALSYPALIARQAGAPDFQQPLAGSPGIPALLSLQGFAGGSPIIAPRSSGTGQPLNLTLPRPYNNIAVPGFRVGDVKRTVTGNGIIDLVLRGLGTQLQQAAAQQPTFTTVWIGNNDVLAAATSGVVIEGLTLTPVASFRNDLRAILSTLSATGTSMVVATVPNVTAIPFVNTLPPVLVDPASGEPVIVGGAPVPLIGPSGPLSLGDKVLLTAASLLGQGIGIPAAAGGTGQPLPNEVVLSVGELQTILDRTAAINAVIREEAANFGAPVVPMDAVFDEVQAKGFPLGGGQVYTTDFLTGGLFSYDGVHASPFGYAVVANEFIRVINESFGAGIPAVDLFPFAFGPEGSAGATIPDSTAGPLTAAIYSKVAGEQLLHVLRVKEKVRRGPLRPPVQEPPTEVPGTEAVPEVPDRPDIVGPGRPRP